jgi:hypothetical protein
MSLTKRSWIMRSCLLFGGRQLLFGGDGSRFCHEFAARANAKARDIARYGTPSLSSSVCSNQEHKDVFG